MYKGALYLYFTVLRKWEMAQKVKYVYIKDCVSVCAKETRNWARGKYSHVSLNNGVGSEKRIVRRFCHCANVIECTYTNLDSIAYYTPLGGGWSKPRPHFFTPGKETGTHFIGGWVGPSAGLDGCVKSRPHRDSIPGTSSP